MTESVEVARDARVSDGIVRMWILDDADAGAGAMARVSEVGEAGSGFTRPGRVEPAGTKRAISRFRVGSRDATTGRLSAGQ